MNLQKLPASHRQQPLINQFNKEEEALLVWAEVVMETCEQSGTNRAEPGGSWT